MSFGPVARGGLAGSHEGFLRGLQELGYVPGQNITIEYRHASGRVESQDGAGTLDVALPPSLLARVERVIE